MTYLEVKDAKGGLVTTIECSEESAKFSKIPEGDEHKDLAELLRGFAAKGVPLRSSRREGDAVLQVVKHVPLSDATAANAMSRILNLGYDVDVA